MTPRIERNPIYQQVNDQLRGLLATDFQLGDCFLTEREISEKYQVSRSTASKALASLVSEGLLEFNRGVETFVRPMCRLSDPKQRNRFQISPAEYRKHLQQLMQSIDQ